MGRFAPPCASSWTARAQRRAELQCDDYAIIPPRSRGRGRGGGAGAGGVAPSAKRTNSESFPPPTSHVFFCSHISPSHEANHAPRCNSSPPPPLPPPLVPPPSLSSPRGRVREQKSLLSQTSSPLKRGAFSPTARLFQDRKDGGGAREARQHRHRGATAGRGEGRARMRLARETQTLDFFVFPSETAR